jgi:hypothetical protein
MKECRECGDMFPLSDFYKHTGMGDGHLNKCKTCVKTRVKKHRYENLELIQDYDRQRDDLPHRVEARKKYGKDSKNRDIFRESKRKWDANNPQKKRAHGLVSDAIKLGKLEKTSCIICENEKTEGHHEDYSKPLEVVWLCDFHHKKRHRQLNKANRKNNEPPSIEDFIEEFKTND